LGALRSKVSVQRLAALAESDGLTVYGHRGQAGRNAQASKPSSSRPHPGLEVSKLEHKMASASPTRRSWSSRVAASSDNLLGDPAVKRETGASKARWRPSTPPARSWPLSRWAWLRRRSICSSNSSPKRGRRSGTGVAAAKARRGRARRHGARSRRTGGPAYSPGAPPG